MSFKSFISQLLKTARDQVFKLDDQAIRYGIQFADLTLTTFENKIEAKIGFDLPIPWTLEDLFADKLINLSNKAQDIIAERVQARQAERDERKSERLAEETARRGRHEKALLDIRTEYNNELKRIENLTNRTTFSTIIKFKPPPKLTEVVILGKLRTTEEPIKPYRKEFRGDLSNDILLGDYREFINQGATPLDIETLTKSQLDVGLQRVIFNIEEGEESPLVTGDFSTAQTLTGFGTNPEFVEFDIKTNKRGAEAAISKTEERDLIKRAKERYQDALEEENKIWEAEKERYRQEDREKRQEERNKKNKNKREREKREKLTPEEREALRLERKQQRQDERDKRQEEREDRKDARRDRAEQNKQERQDNRQRREDERQERRDTRAERQQRIDDAKDARDEAETEFDRDIEDAIAELDAQVALGNITEAQKREILRDIRSEERVDVENAREGIREVRQGIRDERRAERRANRSPRDPKIKFDTSKLKDPAFVRSVYLQTYQFLPQQTKDELAVNLATYQRGLNTTVKSLSIIQGVIGSVRTILSSLAGTGNTLTIVSDSVEVATNLITTLPIPTGAPIGVGLPLNVITSLSQTLDELVQQNEKVNGAAELIEEATPPINEKLEDTLDVIDTILDVITIVLDLVVFLNYVAQSGANSIDDIRNEIGGELNNALEQSGNSSNQGQNVDEQEDLLSRLNPNSNNPLFYKGFRLTLQYVKNEGELTQTRVLGVNPTNGVSLATDLSFTTSPEVLVQEIQFKIDNYNLIFVNDPNIPVFDQLDNLDIEGLLPDVVIPETDLDSDIEIPGLPERLTKKQIRERKRKDRRSDRKERKDARKAGEITRREARKDRRQDRKERKKEAKDRRRNRIRKKER